MPETDGRKLSGSGSLEELVQDDLPPGGTPTESAGYTAERPAARRPAGRPRTADRGFSMSLEGLHQQIVDTYTALGFALKFGMPLPGIAFVHQANACADAWVAAAAVNSTIRKNLERMLTVSVYGAIITAHLPILVSFGIHAGGIPVESPVASLAAEPLRQYAREVEIAQRAAAEAAAQG